MIFHCSFLSEKSVLFSNCKVTYFTIGFQELKYLKKVIKNAKENGAKGISIFTADNLSKEQQAVFVKMKNGF